VSLHYSGSPQDEFPFNGPPKYENEVIYLKVTL
jgi:hypothetical protein